MLVKINIYFQIPQEPSSPNVHHLNNVNIQSTLVQDALGDVVSDFEKTLEYSNNSNHLYNMNNINHHTSGKSLFIYYHLYTIVYIVHEINKSTFKYFKLFHIYNVER